MKVYNEGILSVEETTLPAFENAAETCPSMFGMKTKHEAEGAGKN